MGMTPDMSFKEYWERRNCFAMLNMLDNPEIMTVIARDSPGKFDLQNWLNLVSHTNASSLVSLAIHRADTKRKFR